MKVINLPSGKAHFQFDVELSGVRLRVRLDWLTRWGYYNVTLYRLGAVVARSRALNPDTDLLRGLELGIGSLMLTGAEPTPENLGVKNSLIYSET